MPIVSPHSSPEFSYDIAIVGAGPAGATCALALRGSGLRVLLLDKAHFPRDKVCGDAIPARCEQVLRKIAPAHAEALRAFSEKVEIAACRVVAPSGEQFDYAFHTRGYCSARLDFDHFLLDLALQDPDLHFVPGEAVRSLSDRGQDWLLETAAGRYVARLVVGCDGANGITARQLAQYRMVPAHHCAAVRGYYQGIADLAPDRMEIHFLDQFLPGYFWIFPLPDGKANVGFGMLSDQVAQHKIKLRAALPEIVAQAPGLAERFRSAQLLGPVTGFGLPMGSRKVPLSGERFVLCGDAASLIEPATGEGIGNAMLSGRLAAEHVQAAFAARDWSAERLRAYDAAVYGKLWRDLRNKYRAQRFLGNRKWLMNWLVRRANRPGPVRWLMRKVF